MVENTGNITIMNDTAMTTTSHNNNNKALQNWHNTKIKTMVENNKSVTQNHDIETSTKRKSSH